MSDNRCRNWAFVCYPENVSEQDIINYLNGDLHIQFVISPLHDNDINPDGEPKKAHWHVIVLFSGNKSYEQILKITEHLKATIPIKVQSVRGMVRYFAHLDNPDKFQYDPSKIRFFGGLSADDVLPLSSSERYKIISDILKYIIENGVTNFTDFLSFCMEFHFDDWFPVLCDHSCLIVKEAIKGNFFKYNCH